MQRKSWLQSAGPLSLDRIDLHIEILPVGFEELTHVGRGESSQAIREWVIFARKVQAERFSGSPLIHCNAQITDRMLPEYNLKSHSLSFSTSR